MSAIEVRGLRKEFSFRVRNPDKGLVGNFFAPDTKKVVAVNNISFTVTEGETVGFIGPNGAGKSTSIKMFTGILFPSGGSVRVLGLNPHSQRKTLAMKIGTVFGQRSQLVFNLPLLDSFDLLGKIYEVPREEYESQVHSLIASFELEPFIDQPVRKLSLGQRMRAEVAASLIHSPKIIFLDEPTIGLDVVAKRKLRQTITSINKKLGTTIFLTSHDAGDIESVCARTMMINHGAVVYDGSTADLKRQYLNKKLIRVVYEGECPPGLFAEDQALVISNSEGQLVLEVSTDTHAIAPILSQLMSELNVLDISIEDPPLEEVISEMYSAHG